MVDTIRLGGEKGMSKSDLEQWIWGYENNTGPLKEIDCAEGGTVGTFEDGGDPPPRKAEVVIIAGGLGPCPSGKSEVCKGRAYISGVCMNVRVCR